MKVKIHRNISTKYKKIDRLVYSIISRETKNYGKLIGHAARASAKKCGFHVSQAGHERFKETGDKEVFATIVTDNLLHYVNEESVEEPYNPVSSNILRGWHNIWFDPTKTNKFMDGETGEPISFAEHVLFLPKGIFAKQITYI